METVHKTAAALTVVNLSNCKAEGSPPVTGGNVGLMPGIEIADCQHLNNKWYMCHMKYHTLIAISMPVHVDVIYAEASQPVLLVQTTCHTCLLLS